jgi:hypothetical protein
MNLKEWPCQPILGRGGLSHCLDIQAGRSFKELGMIQRSHKEEYFISIVLQRL